MNETWLTIGAFLMVFGWTTVLAQGVQISALRKENEDLRKSNLNLRMWRSTYELMNIDKEDKNES